MGGNYLKKYVSDLENVNFVSDFRERSYLGRQQALRPLGPSPLAVVSSNFEDAMKMNALVRIKPSAR